MNPKTITAILLTFSTAFILTNCGGGNDSTSNTPESNAAATPNESDDTSSQNDGPNIPYLRSHHAAYGKEDGTRPPVPVKNPEARSIDWIIVADDERNAQILTSHIRFMMEKLESGANPRAFDKLFLMEAYMKYNGYYTTTVDRSGSIVVVSKSARTACAYDVISAHSDAVSEDFFGRGNIMNDYSSLAEAILASPDCDADRDAITAYIAERQRHRGR